MIVSDASPIITFARAGRLDVLQRVVEELFIPEAVYQEVIVKGGRRPGAAQVIHSDWIHRQTVRDRTVLAHFPPRLSLGEREAIALALELGAQLLLDERLARREATARGLRVFGSLLVLAEGKRHGLIGEARPLLDALCASGYRISDDLARSFLTNIGEGGPCK